VNKEARSAVSADIAKAPRRAMHDLGGTSQAGTLDFTPHLLSDFERNVDALVNVLAKADINIVCPDERRRGIESLSPELYRSLTYYQRWLMGVKLILVQKGVLSDADIEQRVAEIRQRDVAR
jgi:nitrile hydratase subunit beta